MSQISRKLLESLTQDYLWMRTLTNQSETKLTEKLTAAAKGLQTAANTPVTTTGVGVGTSRGGSRSGRALLGDSSLERSTSSTSFRMNARTKELSKAVISLNDIAAEQMAEMTLLETKKHIFS